MPIPLLIAGAALLIGAKAHSEAKEVNEQAQAIAQKAQSIYSSQKAETERAQKSVVAKLEEVGKKKQMILLHPMKSFLESYGKLKKVGLMNSAGIDELSHLPEFSFGDKDVLQIEQLTDIYESVESNMAEGATAGALAGLAVTGTGSILTAAGAGALSVTGAVGIAADVAGTALGAVAAAPLALFVAPVAVFTGLGALSKANDNLSKAQLNLAEAERACEEMQNTVVLCEGIIKKADMFENLMINLTELFAQSVAMQNAIIRKKERGMFRKKSLSKNSFTDNELKVFAVSRSLAGALKALIDVPMLNNGEVSEEAEQKYQTVMESLPAYEANVKEAVAVSGDLAAASRKEQKVLLAPVDSQAEKDAEGNKINIDSFLIKVSATALMFLSLYVGTRSYLAQAVIFGVMIYLSGDDEKQSSSKRKLNSIEKIILAIAGFSLLYQGGRFIWFQGRYLLGISFVIMGIAVGAFWQNYYDENNNKDVFLEGISSIPYCILILGMIEKIVHWIF